MVTVRHIFRFVFLLLGSIPMFGQTPCPPLDAGNDTTVCSASSVQLSASTGFDTYEWFPAVGLNNQNIRNPIASITNNIVYQVKATLGSGNLVINGDFSAGNVGFVNDYTFQNFYNPCYYTVLPTFFSQGFIGQDHSPSSDNMFMSIDGCYTPSVLWEQTVNPILPQENYNFSFWATRAGANQPIFAIYFIGNVTGLEVLDTLIGIVPLNNDMVWDEYAVPTWNSGSNTSVTIRIKCLTTDGYGVDFAMDDISLKAVNCLSIDSIHIYLNAQPPLMPADTVVCQHAVLPPLHAVGQNIQWYTSPASGMGSNIAPVPDTDGNLPITYYATQTLSGCESDRATTTIDIATIPYFNLGPDAIFCSQGDVEIGPHADSLSRYTWMDSLHITPRIVSDGDTFILHAQNFCGSYIDSIHISYVNAQPPLMPSDTTVCQYAVLPPLQAVGQNIQWYTSSASGMGSNIAPVPDTDGNLPITYYATQTLSGCESEMASTTIDIATIPYFDLGPDAVYCIGDEIKIGPDMDPLNQYTWMDSLHVTPRVVSDDDTNSFVLHAQNFCGSHTDSIQIIWDECLCYFYYPNTFTPNDDFHNEVFKPVYDCRMEEYDMRIFNRWGELIFESQNPDGGWAGEYKNKPAEQGMYIVQINYAALSGTKKIYKSITDKLALVK